MDTHYRLSTSALLWLAFLVALTSMATAFSAFSDEESDFSALPQITDTMRSKRTSRISCRCCSNSFNSHCCLRCMHRLGKRQDPSLLPSPQQIPLVSIPRVLDDTVTDYTDTLWDDSTATVMESACVCCLYEMKSNPLAELTTCCQQCRKIGD